MTSASARDLSSSLNKLKIDRDGKTTPKRAKDTPVDSWEDSFSERQSPSGVDTLSSPINELPGAPPTSPVSPSTKTGPQFQAFPPFGMNGEWDVDSSTSTGRHNQPRPTTFDAAPDRRPEKTTAAASRLIAAGLGQKPPKRTQEEKEYDQAMKVQEKKRRDAAKDEEIKAQKAKEKAKLAMWED